MSRVYTVNGATAASTSSLPDWLTRKRNNAKGGKRRKEHYEGTIELIQGFEFPEASIKIKTTPDGKHAIATGTYKPQMKVWDLDQLSQKFERHSDAENVDFIVSPYSRTPVPSNLAYSAYQMTGQNPSTYKTIVPSNSTPKEDRTTKHVSQNSGEHSVTISRPATPSSALKVTKYIDSTSIRDDSCPHSTCTTTKERYQV